MLLFILFWLVCSILSYGITFAYFQKEFALITKEKYLNDICFSLTISLFGPFGLIAALLFCGTKHGLKFK